MDNSEAGIQKLPKTAFFSFAPSVLQLAVTVGLNLVLSLTKPPICWALAQIGAQHQFRFKVLRSCAQTIVCAKIVALSLRVLVRQLLFGG
jgi:hypothetical protein